MVEIPNVKWKDIGALNSVIEELKEVVELPLKHPEAFKKMGIKPPKGILLYGPPGTGKTLLAKAVATESQANFISIKGPEILSKWVGDSEKGVRKIFRRARQTSPVIVFFDEIDSIAGTRGSGSDSGVTERVVNQLLTELDGIEDLSNVFFIAATNRPDLIDPALIRAGRVDKLIQVNAPSEKGREEIFKVHLKKVPTSTQVSIEELAKRTQGYSGADIEGLVKEAVLNCLKINKMKPGELDMTNFEYALTKIKPSIQAETEKAYAEFKEEVTKFKPTYVG